MSDVKHNAQITVGMRNVKTAIAATLCALIYYPIQRNPTFACIGAVFGLGNDMENSWLNGGNRLFGTIFGGVLGMLLYSFYLYFYPEGTKEGFNLLILLPKDSFIRNTSSTIILFCRFKINNYQK